MIVYPEYLAPRIEFCRAFRPTQPTCLSAMRVPPPLVQREHVRRVRETAQPLRGLALELLSEDRVADARFVLDAADVYWRLVELFRG